MEEVRPTTEMMWWTTLALAAVDAGLLLLVGRLVLREVFVRLKWWTAAAAFLVYAGLWGTFASCLYWDLVYGRLFPVWSRWLLPVGYGLLFASLALLFWWASLRMPGRPVVTFCLLGGLVSVPGHAVGIARGLLRVPFLSQVSPASALTLGVAEFIVYCALMVALAGAMLRFAGGARGASA